MQSVATVWTRSPATRAPLTLHMAAVDTAWPFGAAAQHFSPFQDIYRVGSRPTSIATVSVDEVADQNREHLVVRALSVSSFQLVSSPSVSK